MEYKYYGINSKPINLIVDDLNIKNQHELYTALLSIWSKETCAPRMRDRWSIDNKTVGQCSITAFLVQDLFGGQVYGIPLGDGNYHCFNVVGDVTFDLASEQFLPKVLDYNNRFIQSRDIH
nr:hypothetical protein [Acholeplasmatales bacterium]